MLLTITTTHVPATDLGYLLHKNPASVQRFELAYGAAHVFYPEASEDRCTAALLLDVDPVGMVRGRAHGEAGLLDQYVNDRPYVASSFLSVAISRVFGSAMGGRSKDRQELAETPIPLVATLTSVPCRGGAALPRRLFEPLGYVVEVEGGLLDDTFPGWGRSPYYRLTLAANCRLSTLLTHLYVLIPVLDGEKHYWVGDDEVEKLLRHGEGWLAEHPERALIAAGYLRRRRDLVEDALGRLALADAEMPEEDVAGDASSEVPEVRISLHTLRLEATLAALKESGAGRVLDLGCGEGRLLKMLLQDAAFTRILGVDVSYRALALARSRLHLDRLPERQRTRIELLHGSLTYRDARLAGFDAAAVVEVIEHLDPARLATFERVLFEFAHPATVVLTTPNIEYNARFPGMTPGALRHRDHRFEWTRTEFAAWCARIAARFGYTVRIAPVGPEDPEVGAPSQLAVFSAAVEDVVTR